MGLQIAFTDDDGYIDGYSYQLTERGGHVSTFPTLSRACCWMLRNTAKTIEVRVDELAFDCMTHAGNADLDSSWYRDRFDA